MLPFLHAHFQQLSILGADYLPFLPQILPEREQVKHRFIFSKDSTGFLQSKNIISMLDLFTLLPDIVYLGNNYFCKLIFRYSQKS